ncbi:MAG: tRNA (adenosine(37)-N6)-threonylcarbamoyltransferase complex ATPase subunit type 1 TsaE [Halanaerobium sp.]|nr:tRNA (adenosine(37)-N6)-threonylcarbamoyltransferase complex ATPase subunit type 1 TsaE [Halanaerobium sp.]
MEFLYYSKSPEDTRRFGRTLGSRLAGGEVILLQGQLGAGKTLLAQAICEGLGVEEYVSSPSYTLVNKYQGRVDVFHLDLYRLSREEELLEIGFADIVEGEDIVLIEWPELGLGFLPPSFLLIEFTVDDGGDERKLSLRPVGEPYLALLEELKKDVSIRN